MFTSRFLSIQPIANRLPLVAFVEHILYGAGLGVSRDAEEMSLNSTASAE